MGQCIQDSGKPRETPAAYSGPIRDKYYIVFIQHNTAFQSRIRDNRMGFFMD